VGQVKRNGIWTVVGLTARPLFKSIADIRAVRHGRLAHLGTVRQARRVVLAVPKCVAVIFLF
jgi:hypothetical protein